MANRASSRTPWDEYEEMHTDLPLYDGRPPAAMRETLRAAALGDLTHEPLMDPTLRGEEPRHESYVVSGTVPAE